MNANMEMMYSLKKIKNSVLLLVIFFIVPGAKLNRQQRCQYILQMLAALKTCIGGS